MKKLLLLITGLLLLFSVEGQILRYSNYTAPPPPPDEESQCPTCEDEVQTYIEGLSTELPDSVVTKINTFVVAVKDSLNVTTLDDFADVILILANSTSEAALRNLVERDHDATAYNSPAFTALRGYKGNGTSSHLIIDYNQSDDADNVTLNSHTMGAYVNTASQAAQVAIGYGDPAPWSYLIPKLEYEFYYSNNLQTVDQKVSNLINTGAFYMSSRTSSSLTTAYINGTSVATDATSSYQLSSRNYGVLVRNNATPDLYSEDQIAFIIICRGLSADEAADVNTCFEAYMDSNGYGIQ